jgi:hypothetical protein
MTETTTKKHITRLGTALFEKNNAANWLRAHGFEPGTQVYSKVKDGMIVLIKSSEK